jgi:hypothetical protein
MVDRSISFLISVVENNIWKGESRPLSITGKAFQKLGWNQWVYGFHRKDGFR